MSSGSAAKAAARLDQQQLIYSFEDFQLNVTEGVLQRRGRPIAVTPKCLDLLILFVENRGRLLTKDELLQSLWPDSFVGESNLTQNVYTLRRILGDDQKGNTFIKTIPRRGYKFVASATQVEAASDTTVPSEYRTRDSAFRSLRAFELQDARLFFGRDSEIEELLERLGRLPTLVLIGSSGSVQGRTTPRGSGVRRKGGS